MQNQMTQHPSRAQSESGTQLYGTAYLICTCTVYIRIYVYMYVYMYMVLETDHMTLEV